MPMRRSHSRTVLSWLEVTTCTAAGGVNAAAVEKARAVLSTHCGSCRLTSTQHTNTHYCSTAHRHRRGVPVQGGAGALTCGSVGSARMEEIVSSCPVRQWA